MIDFIQLFCGENDENFDFDVDTQKITREAIRVALNLIMKYELSEQQQRCIKLKFEEQMTQCEIARTLHISQPTVCRHLAVATHTIYNHLKYCAVALQKANKLWLEWEGIE